MADITNFPIATVEIDLEAVLQAAVDAEAARDGAEAAEAGAATAADDVITKRLAPYDLTTAFFLPGDLAQGIAGGVVNDDGQILVALSPDSDSAGSTSTDSSLATFLPGDITQLGPVSDSGLQVTGGVGFTSGNIDTRRQLPPDGIAQLTGATPNREITLLMRDGTSVPVSAADDDPSDMVQNGNTVSYVRNRVVVTGGASEIVDIMAAKPRLPAGTTRIVFVPFYGQSNSMGGYSGTRAVSTVPESDRVLMLNQEARLTTTPPSTASIPMDWASGLRPLHESNSQHIAGPPGETPCSGFANKFLPYLEPGDVLVMATFGVGGAAISNLSKGSRSYANMMETGQRIMIWAGMLGLDMVVPFVPWVQGEANAATAYSTFKTSVQQIQSDLDTDFKAITGQTENIILLCAQPSSWTLSSITRSPAMEVYVDLARDEPTKFGITGPLYARPYGDLIHLSGTGTRANGETMGEAGGLKMTGTDNTALYATAAVRTGAVVRVTFTGQVGALVLDTSYVTNPGSYGFEFRQTGGSAVTISSVAIDGADVVITLSGTPTGTDQKIGIGTLGVSGNAAGPTTGPRCCLRDSTTETYSSTAGGGAMHKYACHQTISIT